MISTRFVIYKDRAGEYRWRLIAGNNEIVANSEGYILKQVAIRSAQRVKLWASLARIVDVTI